MPVDLPISTALRKNIAMRNPTGTFNAETGQVTQKTLDGTDVIGMVEPILDAVEKLELGYRELQVHIASLEAGRRAK